MACTCIFLEYSSQLLYQYFFLGDIERFCGDSRHKTGLGSKPPRLVTTKHLLCYTEEDHLSQAKNVYIYFYIDSIYFNLTYPLYTYFLSTLTLL